MAELASAFVRIRPDTAELDARLAALEALCREVADALARYSAAPTAPTAQLPKGD